MIEKKQNCTGCYACYNICPKSCITMDTDKEGFWYPKVNEQRCIDCHLCEKGCAVVQAVSEGKIAPSRHESYCVMYDEAKNNKPWEQKNPKNV